MLLVAFFLSGVAGLMHEVVWEKLLVGLVGATAHAQATVLAVLMGGLALGAVLFGRWADLWRRPLRTYLLVELAIGGYCLALPLWAAAGGLGYAALASRVFEWAGLKSVLRVLLAVALILPPAVLMGGALPLLARSLVRRAEQTRQQVARLYALNSLGAVLGVGIAGFVMLPGLGLYASLGAASLLNFAAAALVAPAARRETDEQAAQTRQRVGRREHVPHAVASSCPPGAYRLSLVALALSGFAAMGYQVLFARVIGLAFGSSVYSFSVMLIAFIAGISLGSAVISRLRVERPLWLLGASQLLAFASLVAVTPLIARLPYLIALLRIGLQEVGWGFELYQLGKASLCLAVLLVPTTCLGMSFPLVVGLQARRPDRIGWRVGSTYAWNTLGSVLGALLTGLVLLPGLGLLGAFHLNLVLNLVAGFAVLGVAGEAGLARRLTAGGAAALAACAYLIWGTGWTEPVQLALNHVRLVSGPPAGATPEARARHPSSSFAAWKSHYVLDPRAVREFFFEEDAQGAVLAYSDGRNARLYVNGKPDAGTARDLTTQLLLGHLPLFLAPDARTLLVIGHGSGITAGAALRHPVEHADIVEISPAVLNADRLFAEHNHGVLADPRVRVYVDDGRSFLRTVPRSYDVVVSEPSNPWIAGIGGLFTLEFFESVRGRLNPGGLAVIWFHEYEQIRADEERVLRTIGAVFPHVMLFRQSDYSDLIVVASVARIQPDFAAMEHRFAEPAVRRDLARIGLTNLAGLLSHHAVSQDRFRTVVPAGPLNTVARERLEYAAPRSLFHNESSDFLASVDGLLRSRRPTTDILLDRYIRYRASAGDPVGPAELADAARYVRSQGRYGPALAELVAARAGGSVLSVAGGGSEGERLPR